MHFLFMTFYQLFADREGCAPALGPLAWSRCSWKSREKSESAHHSGMSDSLGPHGLYSLWHSPGQDTRGGSLSLLQGIFLTQELNQGLLHCRQCWCIKVSICLKNPMNRGAWWATVHGVAELNTTE